MGNLVKSPQDILLNKISAKDFGVYAASSGPTNNVFAFRGSTHHAPVRIKDNEVKRAWFALHTPAVKSSYILDFEAPAPCEDCDYETGIVISHDHPYDGRFRKRDYRMYPKNRYYNAVIPSLSTSGTTLDDSDRLEVMKQIIENINGDKPLNAGTVGSLATATMLYKVNVVNRTLTGNDLDITVGGSTYTIDLTTDGAADTAADAININDNVNPYVIAYTVDVNTNEEDIVIVGREEADGGYKDGFFKVEAGTGVTAELSVDNFYLRVNQKYSDIPIQFEWDSKEDAWDTVSKIFEYEVENADAVDLLWKGVKSDGNYVEAAGGDFAFAATAQASAVAASGSDLGGIGTEFIGACEPVNSGTTTDSGNVSIFIYGVNDSVFIHNAAASANAADIVTKYGSQQFSDNDGETMYRHFPNVAGNEGRIPHIADPEKNYCQLHFEVAVPSAGGENVPDAQGTELAIYNFFFPEEYLENDYWDGSTSGGTVSAGDNLNDEDPSTVDTPFFGLLYQISEDFASNGVEGFDGQERPDGLALADDAVLGLLPKESYNDDNGWVKNLLSEWAKL